MHGVVVDLRFDNTHLFLNLSDGQAVRFPLNWFPVLKVATATEREHFAISLDRQQLFWPEIDEDVNVPALLSYRPETVAAASRETQEQANAAVLIGESRNRFFNVVFGRLD
ncbi:DUF2442 domain-containing protein [Paraburkholderia madseniana]|uniref:DUF2442 domain-containing protein n=1 Tax=Paraburkholderia madseniana TaxID=2599607 RepID=A0A6N6WAH5_9BURK|nr:DUF2442 domain-containing protein [Paraburkholderia madseniana]KAE8757181.1 DUF2442 domain-containing protein [Paraburkholderia madseniana]